MSDLLVEQKGKISVFTINRPKRLNALSSGVVREMQLRFAEFDRSDQRVAIITGAGERAFSSGADIDDLPELWRCVPGIGITTEKPVICAVDGWCVGGGLVIAAFADLCVAGEQAKFMYPEGKIGLTGGMIAALASRIPHKLAMEIMLLGRPVSGTRAYEMGLVNKVSAPGRHLGDALEMAEELAAQAPLVLKTLKRFVNQQTLAKSPSERMALAQRDIAIVNESQDLKEGLASFRERRTPEFTGQ